MKSTTSLFMIAIACSANLLADKESEERYRAYKKRQEETPCELKGVAGEQPRSLCDLVDLLKEENRKRFLGEFLLTGRSRVMNRFIVETMVYGAKGKLLSYTGSELIGKFRGSGYQNVQKMFAEGDRIAKETQGPVVIYLDGVDYFAGANDSDSEHRRATSALRLAMDRRQRDGEGSKVFFIASRSGKRILDRGLRGRFDSYIDLNNQS